ncbi:MAG: GntR family transcriptional regulator, partial [Solobacterium sp.]|nr:GntR family transcriptional regulator [Solobacterium sp.]
TDNTLSTDSTDEVITMFLLNLQSKIPIYEQIQAQIIRFIEAGVLNPGDRLPSVRQLAQDNGINPNTVAKAYAELEKAGAVYNLPKKGVYVAEIDIQSSRQQQIRSVLLPLKESGITKDEIILAAETIYGETSYAED